MALPKEGSDSMIILLALLLIGGGVYWFSRRRGLKTNQPLDRPARAVPAIAVPMPGIAGQATDVVMDGLTKTYGKVTAINDLSFAAAPGRVTAFLGPNGAGKTTTLRILLGLTTPTAGTAMIGGLRYTDLPRPIRRVGAVLEGSGAHPSRTGRDHLRVTCRAGGIPLERADEVLTMVGLDAAGRRPVKGYSLGMRQRLGIATALIGNPDVLILDEPANGLDPEGIRWLRDLLRGLAEQGRTVLVSSHLLAEVQALADDVVIIARGLLVARGTVESVLDSLSRPTRTRVRTPDPEKLARALDGIATVRAKPDGEVDVDGLDAAAVGEAAARAGIVVHELSTERPGLEDAFLELTGEARE